MNELVPQNNLIKVFENIEATIAEITDIKEVLDLRNMAKGFEESWKAHYRSSGFGRSQMILGWKAKIISERRMGELLGDNAREKGQTDKEIMSHDVTLYIPKLDELGISRMQSSRYQQLAKADKNKFDKAMREVEVMDEIYTKLFLAKLFGAHVGQNTGEFEWYTPPQYIEAARFVMGKIDLDPASSKTANEIVKAKKFFTVKEDGLKQEWFGNVWMNPPYSQPLIDLFCEKLVSEYRDKNIHQACVLVNNATETAWGQRLLTSCSATCFVKGRIKFVDKEGNPGGAPLQGQMILYFGQQGELFETTFNKFGQTLWKEAR